MYFLFNNRERTNIYYDQKKFFKKNILARIRNP